MPRYVNTLSRKVKKNYQLPPFSDVNCSATTLDNVFFPTTRAGTTLMGQCVLGYSGNGTLPCDINGSVGEWGNASTSCVEVFCPSSTFRNAQWPGNVQTGAIGYASCLAGTAGQLGGYCSQNGTKGFWTDYVGNCASKLSARRLVFIELAEYILIFPGCISGTYQNQTGQLQCSSCQPNSGSPPGATSSSQCICHEGYVSVDGQCQSLYFPLLFFVIQLFNARNEQTLCAPATTSRTPRML